MCSMMTKHKTSSNRLGNRLRQLRGERSVREFAKQCGISHTYLTNLEQGIDPRIGKANQISLNVLIQIADHLGVPYSDLIYPAIADLLERKEGSDGNC